MNRRNRLSYVTLMMFFWYVPVQAAELKVGFVNVVTILSEAPQAQSANKQLERDFSARDAELTAQKESINNLEKRLQTDAQVMSASKREELEKDVFKRRREFKRALEEFKEDFEIRRNEELRELNRTIGQIILEIARTENYDLILDRVIYASETIDITPKVLTKLKQKSGN